MTDKPMTDYSTTGSAPDKPDRSYQNSLYPEDQKRVDEFLNRGINSVQRKPFRPMRLMIMLIVIVNVLLVLSKFLVHWAGINY
jgi:hypothetical protein